MKKFFDIIFFLLKKDVTLNKKDMNEIYSVDELIEVIGDDLELLKLNSSDEKECVVGYSERCNDDRLPVYDMDKILKVLNTLPENNNLYYLNTGVKYEEIPEGKYLCSEFKEAFMGMIEKKDEISAVAYDTLKCIEILEKNMKSIETEDEDSYSLAVEYFYYNTVGAWVGDTTPVFITRILTEEAS